MGENNINERRVIDTDRALDLLKKAVYERGTDYVYKDHFERCQNFLVRDHKHHKAGEAACIVGHAMDQLGLTIRECGNMGAQNTRDMVNGKNTGYFITEGAMLVFKIAQKIQDGGGSWGLARDTARDSIAVLGTTPVRHLDEVPSRINRILW